MTNSRDSELLRSLENIYRQTFHAIDKTREVPPVEVRFYPYININHTIRVRDGKVFVRIADICRDMDLEGHRALARILVSKLFRRRVPKAAREVYDEHTKTAEMRDQVTANKLARGRKIVSSARGEYFDLTEIFDDLNERYFKGSLPKPVLTWSARKTYRILGHHDATHKTIVVSRSLDSKGTPKYVVQYIVYHEMLHIHHPTVHHNGRRYNHTPAFRRDEEKFEYFQTAERWIEQNVRKLKRNAKRK